MSRYEQFLMFQKVRRRSHSSQRPRRIPRQTRGRRRVSQLLDAAAAVIASVGYDAATMSAIAAKAGAPIGSLYQFFPNKEAITHALRTEYGKHYEAKLTALEGEAGELRLDEVVGRLIHLTADFVESHPAFLALMDAPGNTRSPRSLRRRVRSRLAGCFHAVSPRIGRGKPALLAAVVLQLLKGMSHLFAEAPARQRRQLVREYQVVLHGYLAERLKTDFKGRQR
jgi:AcrR family transcriptional regulator